MNCFYLSPQNLLHNWVLYDVDAYTMGLDYVILAYLKVVHYFCICEADIYAIANVS